MITEHTTVTYFVHRDRAQAIADVNNYEDTDGWTYRVEFHAGRQAYFVAVFDESGERLGPL